MTEEKPSTGFHKDLSTATIQGLSSLANEQPTCKAKDSKNRLDLLTAEWLPWLHRLLGTLMEYGKRRKQGNHLSGCFIYGCFVQLASDTV